MFCSCFSKPSVATEPEMAQKVELPTLLTSGKKGKVTTTKVASNGLVDEIPDEIRRGQQKTSVTVLEAYYARLDAIKNQMNSKAAAKTWINPNGSSRVCPCEFIINNQVTTPKFNGKFIIPKKPKTCSDFVYWWPATYGAGGIAQPVFELPNGQKQDQFLAANLFLPANWESDTDAQPFSVDYNDPTIGPLGGQKGTKIPISDGIGGQDNANDGQVYAFTLTTSGVPDTWTSCQSAMTSDALHQMSKDKHVPIVHQTMTLDTVNYKSAAVEDFSSKFSYYTLQMENIDIALEVFSDLTVDNVAVDDYYYVWYDLDIDFSDKAEVGVVAAKSHGAWFAEGSRGDYADLLFTFTSEDYSVVFEAPDGDKMVKKSRVEAMTILREAKGKKALVYTNPLFVGQLEVPKWFFAGEGYKHAGLFQQIIALEGVQERKKVAIA